MRKSKFLKVWLVSFLAVFLICTVATASNDVPSPKEFLGYEIGTQLNLTNARDTISYMETIANASDRVTITQYGESIRGLPLVLVLISAEDNMNNLEQYLDIHEKLVSAQGISDKEAEELALEGKTIVWLDGYPHCGEIGPAEMLIDLVYDLATTNDSKWMSVLDDVIVAVNPQKCPDQRTDYVEWFNKYKETKFAKTSPPRYGDYVGHDTNRDLFTQAMPELEAWANIWLEYKPHMTFDLHQMGDTGPRQYIPPGANPVNPNINSIIVAQWQKIAANVKTDCTAEGLGGVSSHKIFDKWFPGYGGSWPSFHHSIAGTFETAQARNDSSRTWQPGRTTWVDPSDVGGWGGQLEIDTPLVWEGGEWSLSHEVKWARTSVNAMLKLASEQKESIIKNRYIASRNEIEEGLNEPPYAWIIPPEQKQPVLSAKLVNKLINNGVEVKRATEGFKTFGGFYPEGTYVVYTAQPYGNVAKTFMSIQEYPSEDYGTPYDVTGWTFPAAMGVQASEVSDPAILDIVTEKVNKAVAPVGEVKGNLANSSVLALRHDSINVTKALNRLFKEDLEVNYADEEFTVNGETFSAGTIIIPNSDKARNTVDLLSNQLSLNFTGVDELNVETSEVNSPKVALYYNHTNNMREGWTRWIMEDYEFDFERITNEDVKDRNLVDRFDVIILPDMYASSIIEGRKKGTYPAEFTGGIGASGISNLKAFAEEGGTIIALDSACRFALSEFDLGVKEWKVDREEFYVPGSLLEVEVNGGLSESYSFANCNTATVMFANSPVMEVDNDQATTFVQYSSSSLVSGWARGEEKLEEKTAAVKVPYGEGKVLLFGFEVTHRYQLDNTLPFLFDSIFSSAIK